MSNIFDALRRSESEQSGIELPAFAQATDLLEISEQTAVKRGMSRSAQTTAITGTELEQEVNSRAARSDIPPAAVRAGSAPIRLSTSEEARPQVNLDQFSQFQSVRTLVPPQSRLVCLTDKESLAAEKFRFLAVRLRQIQQKRPIKKVLITSTIPQEGKSMISANLSCALARKPQQKTLLIDGDLRRSSLGQLFGLANLSGMSEYLQGGQALTSCIYYVEDAGFWILPAGNSPRNPLELMQAVPFPALMEHLSTWFDWIVIDSPPVLPLGDTSIWMRLADGVLLVARRGISERRQLRKGLEALDSSKLMGAIMNGAAAPHSKYYYAYGQPTGERSTGSPKGGL